MQSTPAKTRFTTEDDITAEVLRRLGGTPDPRLREIMLSLTEHLHQFVKDVRLVEGEWWKAIEFLTATGHMCSDKRQEFILLSDTMGISMLVDLISNARPVGATESTVFGPFYREGGPELPNGANMAEGAEGGTPVLIEGRVLDLNGKPIANAVLDVWQTDPQGLYDAQRPELEELHMRAIYRTDADGNYSIRTTRPVQYQIPNDGPVGDMLRATNRHPWRPAHVHFKLTAPGYMQCTTHLFDREDPYLDSDAVFGVKDSLICDFGDILHYDFVLAKDPAA
ncbi:MAG: intradiol ring-cleavage dioxygenase [Acidobacteriota bacterium]|nr:intradiol ring-cleavage dioxygenase [Acidobacteriota bacterium]